MPHSNKSNDSKLAQFLQNIYVNNGKLVTTNLERSNSTSTQLNENQTESLSIYNLSRFRSKSKTIKIFVASNKNGNFFNFLNFQKKNYFII